jgi:hypothetical protein
VTTSANPVPDLQRDQLITAAHRISGIIGPGQEPDADQIAAASIHFNLALLELQMRGIVLTSRVRTTLALLDSTASYTLDTDTIDVFKSGDNIIGTIVDSDSQETPVYAVSATDYQRIMDKTQEAERPTKCFIDKGGNTLTAYFWPVPSDDITFSYTKVRLLRANDTGATTMELRRTWAPWMLYRLASGVAMDNSKPELGLNFLRVAEGLLTHAQATDVEHVTVSIRPGHSGKNWR